MNIKRNILVLITISLISLILPIILLFVQVLDNSNKIQAEMAYFTFLAVIVALFGEKIWDSIVQPKLEIKFELAPPGCHKTQMKGPEVSFTVYYFRVLVKNYGLRQADECEVMLEKIYFEENGNFELYANYTPVTLKWTGSRNPYLRNIQPERGVFCDLGRIHHPNYLQSSIYVNMSELEQKQNKFMLELAPYEQYYSQWDCLLPGKYKLDLVVYSRNSKAVRKTLEITWSGQWSDEETEMFEKLIIK